MDVTPEHSKSMDVPFSCLHLSYTVFMFFPDSKPDDLALFQASRNATAVRLSV